MLNKTNLLDKIYNDIEFVNKYGTNLVKGSGNIDSNIVIIGEAPGKKEDELKLPFQGKSGKVLDQLLLTIGINRDDVYITNLVKHRPPKNRDPKKSEWITYLQFLNKELDVVNPKIILCLGRISLKSLIPTAQISETHGTVAGKYKGIDVFSSYHPAYGIYNRKNISILEDDFKSLNEIIKKGKLL